VANKILSLTYKRTTIGRYNLICEVEKPNPGSGVYIDVVRVGKLMKHKGYFDFEADKTLTGRRFPTYHRARTMKQLLADLKDVANGVAVKA